ncbi:MAG: NUDIX hydrolase [Kordiimonadaceae bacterium]|jgi:8-oxo-dGTP pyrophosphatase MutT (NUDIX family)|nr:NUDIX hydrolase [Kordiimonadaceae bacterium]MBT6035384.1 NUDIX hydrolase [Kordiimonadaceae bacterium]MBT6330242.1 NUDIX hydrolase [Kordiimonadaceae bacterium]MBT7582268.1 NUDIX hydrolase [Kordiimonadaceae bacterium]
MADNPVLIDSASILIIRDNDDGALEVLMVKRHQDIKFAGGAYVFPGGKVDEEDLILGKRVPSFPPGYGELSYTAFREVFEESGLIIGKSEGATAYREDLLAGNITLTDFIKKADVQFDVGDIVPFARWVTPRIYPKRFDTRFFLARAPLDQEAIPDFREIVETAWVKPLEFIIDFNSELMFPTIMNLKLLGQANTVEDALAQARLRKIITVEPRIVNGKKHIDPSAGYGEVDQTGIIDNGFKNSP